MAIRKVHITREAAEHIAGDGHLLARGGRLLTHIASSLDEMGVKGMAVATFEQGHMTVVGESDGRGWSLSSARAYAAGWERIFGR